MNTTLKLLLAGLLLVMFSAVACGEEPDESDTGGDGDSDSDTDGDADGDSDTVDTTPFELSALEGKTFLVQFDKGYWTTPANVGEEVGSYVPGFLMQIDTVDATAGTFTGRLGTADDTGAQNMANKTVAITGTVAEDGEFVMETLSVFEAILSGPEDAATGTAPQTVAPIHDFSIAGTFADGGDRIIKGLMLAMMDFRDIDCLFALINDPAERNADNICSMMSDTLGYSCEECTFEAGTSVCVSMKAELFKSGTASAAVTEVADFDMTNVNDSTCQ